MGPDSVVAGSTNVSVVIRIMDSTAGTPEEGVTSATGGLNFWYRRQGAALVNFASEGDLTALTDAHSDEDFLHIDDGYYRVDVPDAAFATGADHVTIGGTVTGMIVYGITVRLTDPINGLFGVSYAISSAGNTTTNLRVDDFAGYANDEFNNELWWVRDVSADEWHPVWVTDFDTTNGDATVETAYGAGALPFTPEASVDRVWRSGLSRNNITAADAPTNWADHAITASSGRVDVGLIEGADATDQIRDAVVDDATRIDASALNTAAGAIGSDGTGLTEAGGDGDHLTAVPWNAAWDAQVESEVIDGMIAHGLTAAAAAALTNLMTGVLVVSVNDASATTTAFATDGFTEATDDHFNGRLITFISGALLYQQTEVTDYDAAGGAQGSQEFTVTALTEAPANNDQFIVH